MFFEYVEKVRAMHPLVHCITNYVTVNDCANVLLGCGASPIMADDVAEAGEITAISSALVLNIGTLNSHTVPAMLSAGKTAKTLGRPVVFDPVGAGASRLRTDCSLQILTEVRPDVVRCNSSELKMLMDHGGESRGVDAAVSDRINENTLECTLPAVRQFASMYHCVTAVSGELDVIAEPAGKACVCRNGHAMMPQVTGSGCMLSALCGAFAAAGKADLFEAVSAAFLVMGIAGETAFSHLEAGEGNAAFRNRMIDAVYNMTGNQVKESMRYELR